MCSLLWFDYGCDVYCPLSDGSDYQLVSGGQLVFAEYDTTRSCHRGASLEPTETFKVVLSEGANSM